MILCWILILNSAEVMLQQLKEIVSTEQVHEVYNITPSTQPLV